MLREDQITVIREFVSETYFDQEKLIKYLTIHDMVGIEVFKYVAKDVYPNNPADKTALSVAFIDGNCASCFEPMSVDVFIRRIPFNFYIEGEPTVLTTAAVGKSTFTVTAIDSAVDEKKMDVSGYKITGP